MPHTISKDTLARIQQHIARLDNADLDTVVDAEFRLLRFGVKAVEPLLAILQHSNPVVRLHAGWILGKSRDPRAFEQLCLLLKDEDGDVRYDIAVALGWHRDIRSIPILWEFFRTEEDPIIAGAAAMGLAKFGDRPVSR